VLIISEIYEARRKLSQKLKVPTELQMWKEIVVLNERFFGASSPPQSQFSLLLMTGFNIFIFKGH
jgi:hypothetical protein